MLPESTAARFVGILQRLRDMNPNSIVRAAVVLQMPAIAKACPAFAHELVTTFIQEFSEPMPPDVKNEAVACFTDALDACPNMAKELANALLPYCTCDPDTEAGPNAIKNVAQFLKACPTHAEAFVEKLVNLGEHDTPEYRVAVLKQILPAIAAVPRRATELANVVVHISQTSIHKKPRIEALKLLPDLAKLFPKRSMEFESAALDVCMGGSDDWLLMGGAENIDAAIEAFPESADIFISALLTGSVHRKRENRALAMRFIPVAAKACPRRADDLIRRLLCGCVDVSSCVRVEALRQMCFAVKCHPPRAVVIVRHMLRCCSQNDLYTNFFAREQLPNVLKAVPDITVHLMSILIGVSPEDSDEKAAHLENTLGKRESKRTNRGHVTTMSSRKRQKHDVDQ